MSGRLEYTAAKRAAVYVGRRVEQLARTECLGGLENLLSGKEWLHRPRE